MAHLSPVATTSPRGDHASLEASLAQLWRGRFLPSFLLATPSIPVVWNK
jgi:hypothetical protein